MPKLSTCQINSSFLLSIVLLMAACSKSPAPDPCCTISDAPAALALGEDQAAIQVNGSTKAYFYVLDEAGQQVGFETLNEALPVDAGKYTLKLNNSTYSLEVDAGELATCVSGTIITLGATDEYYYVSDTTGQQLAFHKLGQPLSFFPGMYGVKVNNTETQANVKIKEVTELKTGTIVVHGTTNEYYYVLDDKNNQLAFNSLEKGLSFLPGDYALKLNNSSTNCTVSAGKTIEMNTGTLVVKGLTDEYYYVTDTAGHAMNFQTMNKPLSFFPGDYDVKVNNTFARATVSAGQNAEYATGSIMLKGTGNDYYYVLDQEGKQLNFNSLNRSLSFFPSEYTVKLGSNSRKAVISAGQLTSMDVFR